MKKTLIAILFIVLGISIKVNAQGSVLDDFSYIIVPIQFDFQDSDNEFQLNSLVRHMFKEEGFEAFMSEENLPMEFHEKPCGGLMVDLKKERNILRTLITIQLRDCRRKLVFQSSPGESREKDFRKAHHEAFKKAFRSIEDESIRTLMADRKNAKTGTEKPQKLTREEQKKQTADVVKAQSEEMRYAGTTYLLFNRDGDYEIYDDSGFNKLADIKKADGKTFLYHSEEINGVANFDENGNLVVQFMDEVVNEIETFTYKIISK